MQHFRRGFFLAATIILAGCETPLADSWNGAVSRVTGRRESGENESDERNGLHATAPRRDSLDSDTVYLGPKPPRQVAERPVGGGEVRLKPFRNSGAARTVTPQHMPSATPRSSPKPSPRPTPKKLAAPSPTPPRESAHLTEETGDEPRTAPPPAVSNEPPPFASPVPGKKGYVTSPFSPGAGFIDVTGLEPGSSARDPYSGKIFRVP